MRFIVVFLLVMFALPVQAAVSDWAETQTMSARLVAAVDSNNGEKFVTGVEVKLSPGWHTYWRSPGDAGLAPVFDWSQSENVQIDQNQWPVPGRYFEGNLQTLGYGAPKDNSSRAHVSTVVFPFQVSPLAQEDISIVLQADFLVCHDICVPEQVSLSLNLPAGDGGLDAEAQAILQRAEQALPVQNLPGLDLQELWIDQMAGQAGLCVQAKADAVVDVIDLFIETPAYYSFDPPVAQKDNTRFCVPVREKITDLDSFYADLAQAPITVTLVTTNGAVEKDFQVSYDPAQISKEVVAPSLSIIILFMALVGGLILNLMPCVLPVLSLKVLAVLEQGGKVGRQARLGFIASSAGIVFSFWVIAAFLAVLKASGSAVGWGIQFQNPGFLIFLIIVVMLFALNLLSVFEIHLPRFIARRAAAKPADETTLTGHFLAGSLATLLATPCTAPFLGTAIGFALAGSAVDIFAIFTALGLGMAMPFLAFALFPQVMRWLPKPGAWMLVLKKIMGLALVLTALWLATILGATSRGTAEGSQDRNHQGAWQVFDQSKIAPYVADGRLVFVDVTADWCLTCKANKKFVLDTKRIQAAFAQHDAILMQADWTARDDSIRAYLQEHGRYGIPFNIVYGPARPDGLALPELLTADRVEKALIEALGKID